MSGGEHKASETNPTSFLLSCRATAMVCADPHLREQLRRRADELQALLPVTAAVTPEQMRDLVAAWTRASIARDRCVTTTPSPPTGGRLRAPAEGDKANGAGAASETLTGTE